MQNQVQNEVPYTFNPAEETILLVDDEAGIRRVLSVSLADGGYRVVTAINGLDALRVFEEEHPAIVLTDIKMPGMTGTDLLREIKVRRPDTEVIMISGHGDMDLAIKSLKHDATDFITKPINDDVLEIALKRAAYRITTRRQLAAYTENLETLVRKQAARLVAAERALAVSRTVEGISTAIWNMLGDMEGGIGYLDEMPCHVAIHNRQMQIVATNRLFQKRFGDRIGHDSWAIYTKNAHKDGADCPVSRTLKTGKGQHSRETFYCEAQGKTPMVVYTTPIRGDDGKIDLVLEIFADIKEIRQLQEKLAQTEQQYQQLFDAVPCYITVQDRDLRIVAANQRFKEEFGETARTFCFRVYKKREAPCRNCPVQETFTDGKSHQSEMVVTTCGGRQSNLLVSTASITDRQGEVVQVMEMATDITEVRKLQDQLSSLGLKIGTISHGIKGLLTGLDGGMYTLDYGFSQENRGKIQEGWEIVKLMVRRIRGMILDILNYAKEQDLQWEFVNALRFARDVAFSIDPLMKQNNITFVCDFDPSAGSVEIDSGVVRSALINILENAVDACMAKEDPEPKQIRFQLRSEKQGIVFAITDNGIGMDAETRRQIFTLFFSSKQNRGTGLGLYIADQIIQQHGGKIALASEKGKGTIFTIHFPRSVPEELKTARSASPEIS